MNDHASSDERIFEAVRVDDAAILHEDGVLDVGARDHDAVADCGERADVRVGNDRVASNDDGASNTRALDLGARLDANATFELTFCVDVDEVTGLEPVVEHGLVRDEKVVLFAGVEPPGGEPRELDPAARRGR